MCKDLVFMCCGYRYDMFFEDKGSAVFDLKCRTEGDKIKEQEFHSHQ